MKARLYYMDILRLLSVTLVMFGHFVMVASFAPSIPLIINDTTHMPLLDGNKWHLWCLDAFLVGHFGTQAAILGVLMFFLITGYLIAEMLERYTRQEFLTNRVFRIFPGLAASILVIGSVAYITQDITYPLSSYLSTLTLTVGIFHIPAVTGVIWTLIVEFTFYLMACCLGRFNCVKLVAFQLSLLGVIAWSAHTDNEAINMLAYNGKYMTFILVGTAIRVSEGMRNLLAKAILIIGTLICAYMGMHYYAIKHADTSTYSHVGSLLIAFGTFTLLYVTRKLNAALFGRLPAIFYKAADLVYPIYLIHAIIGLETIAVLRPYIHSNYALLACAVAAAYLLSAIVHVFVEKPGISIGRRFLGRGRTASSDSSLTLNSTAT